MYNNYQNPYNNFMPNNNGQNNNYYNNSNHNTNIIYVNGENDVLNRILPPDSDYLFVDNNDSSIVYRKIINPKGHFEVYTYKREPSIAQESEVKPQSIDLSSYAKKSEIDTIEAKIKGIEQKIEKLVGGLKTNGTKQ